MVLFEPRPAIVLNGTKITCVKRKIIARSDSSVSMYADLEL